MILTCPSCIRRYEVDADKFPTAGRDVRCSRCGHVWHALPELDELPETEFHTDFAAPEAENFAAGRDTAPQVGADEEEHTALRPKPALKTAEDQPWYTRRAVLFAGWAGLALVVLVIAVVASVYHRDVVKHWPKSATLYKDLGVKPAPEGLKILNVSSSEAPQNGQIVLTVAGAVTNVGGHELPVPQIRVGLIDRDKRELYHWTVAPTVLTLKPGQSTRFVTRLSSPPEGAATYEVRFAKAGE